MKRIIAIILSILVILVAGAAYIYFYEASTFEAQTLDGTTIHGERFSIKVPENRNREESKNITVKFIRLKSFNSSSEAPIFYLAGGPGDGCRDQIDSPYMMQKWSNYLQNRDIILIDQRGVSNWKMWWVNFKRLPENIFADEAVAVDYVRQIAHKSKRAFEKRNIDLNAYNSLENAKDIDAIRSFLDYDKIIPYGFSYGTHLGLSYIKYFESYVDKAILIGVEGLDQTTKMPMDLDRHLAMIGTHVSQDSSNKLGIPDIIALHDRVMQRLDNQPIAFEVRTPFFYKTRVNVGSFGLNYILKRDLGDSRDIPNLVRLLSLIDQGKSDQLQHYIEKRYREFVAVPAMHMAMDLSSGVSRDRQIQVELEASKSRFGNMNNFPHSIVDEVWNIEELGDDFRAPHSSSVPLLICSGTMDVNTPSYQGDIVQQNNPQATHLIVENSGHEHIMHHKEFDATVLKFLNNEDVSQSRLSYPSLKF